MFNYFHFIAAFCCRRGLKVAVVGVPKTIDNDILLMDKTFGFGTAVEEAQQAINSAYIEAHSAYHGIGIVKLMGRSSGFIAMHASLASGQIDICLIPEVPFHLHGPHGVLRHLKYLIETKGSAVVCVAEGAGQVSLDLVKSLYAKFIDWDDKMIDHETITPAHATNIVTVESNSDETILGELERFIGTTGALVGKSGLKQMSSSLS
ncbi:ATP-dependent 6-phosphofructokinase 5, chloroplastic-like [Humulus lupulus]|uniref:ATP-dependent 6-phosphofructokinase 5, chloroplastic-like n=1 Tax=Humulus lupulus TaxID=3486 RepID=UPI002B412077|nr:ATP-dependent 6-phosphofructokinase 5, chloroplastic-like [Humulus lupulus]